MYSLKIKRRLSDHPVTEGRGKKNNLDMTIVIDNVMYSTCGFLGLIITKCDCRNAANQMEESGVSLGEEQSWCSGKEAG